MGLRKVFARIHIIHHVWRCPQIFPYTQARCAASGRSPCRQEGQKEGGQEDQGTREEGRSKEDRQGQVARQEEGFSRQEEVARKEEGRKEVKASLGECGLWHLVSRRANRSRLSGQWPTRVVLCIVIKVVYRY